MRRIFSMLALCAAFGMVSAQTLEVAKVIEVKPGETAIVELEVNTNGVEYGAFQANLVFPETGFTLGKVTANTDWESGSITVGTLKDGKANLGGLSISDSPMPNGVVGTFEVKANSDVAYGEYPVTIANFEFINGVNDVKINDVTFTIKVVNAYSVTLDEDATEAPNAATGVNVIVRRTIPANNWSTICLPFAMNADQLAAAFPNGVELGDFISWASEENDGDIVSIEVGFESVSAIEANHPYIIKVAEAVSEFTVEGVDIDPEEEPCVEVGKKKIEKGFFTGTYKAGTEIPENNLFLSGGKFWYATSSTKKMQGFRGFFEFYDVLAIAENSGARINITFDDITGIKSLKNANGEEIFTLSGQRVQNAGKGVYIVNGKKVIKK